jgi:hypothetical protein
MLHKAPAIAQKRNGAQGAVSLARIVCIAAMPKLRIT